MAMDVKLQSHLCRPCFQLLLTCVCTTIVGKLPPVWCRMSSFCGVVQLVKTLTVGWTVSVHLSTSDQIFLSIPRMSGARGSVVVKALCYKPERLGFDTR
jgi:hypothetical protein